MNDNIRNRFLHYSETPPAAVWPRIAAALDTPAYAQKLRGYETQPPAAAWERLEQQLTKPTVVSLRTKLFKYAIAAAVLLFVAAGSVFYFTNKSATLADRTHDTISTRTTKNTFLQNAQLPGPTDQTAPSADESDDVRSDGSPTASLDPRLVQYSPQVHIADKLLTAEPITVTPQEKLSLATQLPDRYMIATTSTGKVVRLPKKAYSEYACAEMLQNYQCKEKLQAIQSKMAASVAIDFTDFIDLLKNLQDNP